MATLSLPRTVKEQLADHLRDEIVRGTFEPGEHLRLEEIATRFEVRTMPVREALRDLESEGLVTIYPHRGAVVTDLTAEDIEDIYEIRATVEAMATRQSIPRMAEAIKCLCYSPGLHKEAAEWFVEKGVKGVGVDQQALDHPPALRQAKTIQYR